MSLWARILIGIITLLFGISFLVSAIDPNNGGIQNPFISYGLTIFFFTVTVTCFFPQTHSITLRLIGSTIFFAFAIYIVESFGSPNLFRALMGFIVWGLPSGYIMITGKFPSWHKASNVFNQKSNKK